MFFDTEHFSSAISWIIKLGKKQPSKNESDKTKIFEFQKRDHAKFSSSNFRVWYTKMQITWTLFEQCFFDRFPAIQSCSNFQGLVRRYRGWLPEIFSFLTQVQVVVLDHKVKTGSDDPKIVKRAVGWEKVS